MQLSEQCHQTNLDKLRTEQGRKTTFTIVKQCFGVTAPAETHGLCRSNDMRLIVRLYRPQNILWNRQGRGA